ncbi:MAG: deoxyguanosinetriphosphate triphosphohydrolase [Oceanococcus sp.]
MKLAAWAANPEQSLGRRFEEAAPQMRTHFQRDRDRIVHSTGFRRLVYKTQVFVNHEGDLFRTRLTHSLEVAQIARTVARNLNLNEDLTETISLAHDLGHTPFGHAGQEALNRCMREHGGFEHNLQSLRVVDELEEKYVDFRGLNLCFESREGILKHCSRKHARELGDIGLRFLNRQKPSCEAQLSNLADEIAYNNHDIDDGLRAGLLSFDGLRECRLFERIHTQLLKQYPLVDERRLRHEVIRRMINHLVIDLTEQTRRRLADLNPKNIQDVREHSEPVVAFSEPIAAESRELKSYLLEHLYKHHRVHRSGRKAQSVISELFEAFASDARLLPERQQQTTSRYGLERVVADYIAGMTDRFAIEEHERMFDPRKL